MNIEPHHAQSLTDAGIGKVYHDKTLSEMDHGPGLKKFLINGGGDALKNEGASLILRGYPRATTSVFCKGLHMNGVGVRMVSLSNLVTTMRRCVEAWEDIEDCRALVIQPAQTESPCPLDYWQKDMVETYLTERARNGKSVILCFDAKEPEVPWWNVDFLTTLMDSGIDRAAVGASK